MHKGKHFPIINFQQLTIAVKLRYMRTSPKCMLFLFHVDRCSVINRTSISVGEKLPTSIKSETCLSNFKPFEKTWLRIWLKSINIPRWDYFVNVTLKNYDDGRSKKSWKLTSNDSQRMTNFDVEEAGDWFQIKSVKVSFDVHYMSYSSS